MRAEYPRREGDLRMSVWTRCLGKATSARPPLAVGLVAALSLIGSASAPAAGGDQLAAKRSLRPPLTGENFYFVMADRFANGSASNNRGGIAGSNPLQTGFDPTHKGFFHGGDLKGLRSKLGYIKGLGTTAIWLTPSFENKPVDGPPGQETAGYHGYWPTDFTRIDPHFGTNAELRQLVNAAHARGMKVFFDIITNHTADVTTYQQKAGGPAPYGYVSKDDVPYRSSGEPFDDRDYAGKNTFPALNASTSFPFVPQPGPITKAPAWLNDVRLYHNRGNTTFTGENTQYGDFFGLDDLFTEHPRVVAGMTAIYKKWITDFGIDGFRIDTMKHVNVEFWQSFAPQVLRHARAKGKRQFFMFGEVFDTTKPFTSHYTTRAKVQAVLDFPFQDAARSFASKSAPTNGLRDFFLGDDWYTDADSNAYQLPTFLGNHDMGRIGHFARSDNVGASDSELLQRLELAHELMYFSRGNPTVYYGDEQGFAGDGGDQEARQDMFPSQVADYQDDDNIGTDATPADSNFDQTHPLYLTIQELANVTRSHPALRNGPQQHRYSTNSAGIYAFSRFDRRTRREYVVVLNNAETQRQAVIPTSARAGTGFARVYGLGAPAGTTNARGRLPVLVAPLSALVYRSSAALPRSAGAPRLSVAVQPGGGAPRDRIEVKASVAGKSLCDVTFYAKVGRGAWRAIGTDDNSPYRVFHDVANVKPGTRVQYRAVVLDNAGHRRQSTTQSARVAVPSIALVSPEAGARVRDSIRLEAVATPDQNTFSVTFQRSVDDGPWTTVGTPDSSQPAYVRVDDISGLTGDTEIRYRARLRYAPGKSVTSAARTATVAPVVSTAVVHYHRPGADYDGWGIHLWGSGKTAPDTPWDAPQQRTGTDSYGAYFEIPLSDDSVPLNFIIHTPSGDTVPTTREPGGDRSFVPMQHPEIWLLQGDPAIYTSEPTLP